MYSGIIFDIMHFSTHDGPGIRTTVFLKGCPLQCAWCHNPESQSLIPQIMLRPNLCIACQACLKACPNGAITNRVGKIIYDRTRCHLCGQCVDVCVSGAREMVGRQMWSEDVLREIEKDQPFYDESGGGVTFSGGETLIQFEFLKEMLHLCHQRGIHTALDTSGFAPWVQLEEILPDVDLFLYDIKSTDDAVHQKYVGVSNHLILENIRKLSEYDVPIIIRMPYIPSINDTVEQIQALGELAGSLKNLVGIEILAYHKIGIEKYKRLQLPYLLVGIQTPEPYQLEAAAHILKQYDVQVTIGN